MHNLPSQPTAFVGREVELADIARLLADPGCRLLTLVGPGGIGKTRLAVEAARALTLPHGAYFVPLQPLTSPDFMVSTIADALNFTFYGEGEPKTQLLHYLREKHLLLVLDNFEHLVDGVDLLPEILDTAPDVKLLVTSRERLRLREEWVFDVRGLPFPEHETTESLDDYTAVQLFIQHARRAGYTPSDADIPAIIHICQMVEGSPLALELAAAWVRAMPCAEIAREIERSLNILTTTTRNVPEKHRSMRAAFERSWNLLTEEEQAVFRKLSVFRGGFTREAAEQVAGATLQTLASLVDKSLLKVDANGRYDLHELMRQYAEEQLDLALEREQTQAEHSAYYAAFVYQREQELFGNRQKDGLEVIEADIDNVRVAFRHAVEQGKLREIHQIADGLWFFYEMRGWYHESEQTFRQAVEHLHPLLHGSHEGHDQVLGLCLALHGWSLHRLHQAEEARDVLHKSLAILRPLPAGKALHRSLGGLGDLQADYGERMQWTLEALMVAKEIGFPYGIAASLSVLSEIAFDQGNYADARKLCHEALAIFRQLDNKNGLAGILRQMSYLAQVDNRLAEARQLAQEALVVSEAINHRHGMMNSFIRLGWIAHAEGNYSEAKQHYQRCIEIAQAINYRKGLAFGFVGIAHTDSALGNGQEAWSNFQQALNIALEIQSPPTVITFLGVMAQHLVNTGKKELASEVCAFVVGSPASDTETRRWAQKLLDRLKSEFDPDEWLALQKRSRTLDEIVTKLLVANVNLYPDPQPLSSPLSDRELEILSLVADGLSTQEVAQKLFLSVGTVRWYLNQIYSKLYVHSRVQAVARARELKLLA